MIDIICALCGKKQQVETLYLSTLEKKDISLNIYSARRIPDKVHYRILKCTNCGLIFSSPILPIKQTNKFYRESLCNYAEQIPFLIKTYMKILDKIKNNLPQNPKVLEVGCGNGFFLKELSVKGITNQIFGVEPSSRMVSQANKVLKKRIKKDVFRSNQFPKSNFDLICSFHTLDHMIDPSEFVSESFSLLKIGGFALVVVHDTDGLSVRLFGERSPIFDIEHIYLFNKKTLRELFIKHGFKVIDVFDIFNTYPVSYWWNMSGLPKSVKRTGNYIIGKLRIGKLNLTLPAGNIGIIAKKA